MEKEVGAIDMTKWMAPNDPDEALFGDGPLTDASKRHRVVHPYGEDCEMFSKCKTLEYAEKHPNVIWVK
jgi:hypothetical protein